MLQAWTRQRVDRLYRAWAGNRPHARPTGWLYHSLSATWRTSQTLYRRWIRARQPLLLSLDKPARLTGCGSITGWILSREAEVVAVEAWVNGQLIATTAPNHQRRDAHAAYPFYPDRQAGFRLCPLAGILPDGMYPLHVVARDAAGNTADLYTTLHLDRFTLTDDSGMTPELFGSNREYQFWLKQHDAHSLAMPTNGPLYTIIVTGSSAEYHQPTFQSIQQQTYSRWEALKCHDTDHLQRTINTAHSEFLLLLPNGDQLHPQALQAMAWTHQDAPADVFYTDEDTIDSDGNRSDPFFKPAWHPELLLCMPRMGNVIALRRNLVLQADSIGIPIDDLTGWELALRVTDLPGCRIRHLPGVFYHRQKAVAQYDVVRTHRCLDSIEASLERRGRRCRVEAGRKPDTFRIRSSVQTPSISILIPTRDQPHLLKRCLTSLRERTDYPDYEIIVLDNGSEQRSTHRYLNACPADRIMTLNIPFNHSQLNNMGASAARGEYLVLLNDDTQVLDADWLHALVEEGQRPDVGAVGAWLLYPDGQTQHAGIILDPEEIAFNLSSDLVSDELYRGLCDVVREVSAVTGACLLVRRELYLESGGLDAIHLPTSFNDIDFCLKLRQLGWRIIHTPFARLIHHESATRSVEQGKSQYRKVMQERWSAELKVEPFWNRHLGRLPDWNRGLAFRWK